CTRRHGDRDQPVQQLCGGRGIQQARAGLDRARSGAAVDRAGHCAGRAGDRAHPGLIARTLASSHPPLEGEGRLTWSAAKCETGWGDLSTRALLDVERPSPHPAAHFMSVDPPPPGEGNRAPPCYASRSSGQFPRSPARSGVSDAHPALQQFVLLLRTVTKRLVAAARDVVVTDGTVELTHREVDAP